MSDVLAAPPAELYESIVVNVNDVVLVTEAEPLDLASDGPRVIYVNPAFTRMTGYSAAEIVGRTPRLLQSPKTDRRELDRLRGALTRWEPVEVELLNVRKDGTEFWVQINITPVANSAGWWTHWVAIQRDITPRKRRDDAIAAMLRGGSDLMLVLDDANDVINAGTSAGRMLGRSPESLIGPLVELVHPDDLAGVRALLLPHSGLRFGRDATTEVRLRHAEGTWRWVEASAADIGAEIGSGIVLACADISVRKQAEADLQVINDRFRSAFDDAPIGMAVTEPSGHIVQANAALTDLLGYEADLLLTMSIQDFTHPDDIEPGRRQRAELLAGSPRHRYETRFVNVHGQLVGVLHSSSVVPGSNGKPRHLVEHIEDITERKMFENDLRHQALHDTLTGLPNRALLMDRLEQALGAGNHAQQSVAVLFIDVDRFKVVNDGLGHHAGDVVLAELGQRIVSALRPGDTAARLAGDEFVVLLKDSTPERAAVAAHELGSLLSEPVMVLGTPVAVSASIGIALSSTEVDTPDSLLRDADTAMYAAKDNGGDRVEIFDEQLDAQIKARLQLEDELREGIAQGQLRLHYQPEVNLIDGTVGGLEALVRWQHPRLGLLQPNDFIGLAEDTGLIIPLGAWVLDEALHEAARRRRVSNAFDAQVMWVNLSAVQVHDPGLIDNVARALRRHGLSRGALGLEITESVLMRDFDTARQTLISLRDMGVFLAIDDFGTGYSSLSYLARFPVDTVKIDLSFTTGLDNREHRRESFAVVSAVIGLAHALQLRVVAEGVETVSQAQILHGLGCNYGQGFLLGRPSPLGEPAELADTLNLGLQTF